MLEITFDWPDWSESAVSQSEPQLLCTYVNNMQLQTLIFSADALQRVVADTGGGLLWGAWVIPDWTESTQTTLETKMRVLVTDLHARADTGHDFYLSLEILGVMEDSPRAEILLGDTEGPYLQALQSR